MVTRHRSWGDRVLDVCIYSVLVWLMIVSVYPLIHVLFASLKGALIGAIKG